MRGSGLRLGRLFGIDLAAEWSWTFIFVLMAWNLTAVFGQWHPDWGGALRLGLALCAAILFFASVVVHELAHALVARAFGIRVRDITLFLFGGVSNIEQEPPSAKAELLIAIVGPITSLALGFGLGLIAAVGLGLQGLDWTDPRVLSQLGPVQTLLFWLAPVNVTVGLFNLVPGFPLDGGRVLRAALWSATGDLRTATRWASWIGQAIGWGFVLLGIASVFGARVPFVGGFSGGLWLAFIGWFLRSAAEQSYARLVLEDLLRGVLVWQLMRRSGPAVPADASVARVAHEWFMRSDEQAFPVLDGDRLAGVIAIGDVRRTPQDAWERARAADVMTPRERLVIASPDEELVRALQKMAENDLDLIPVMDGDRLAGILERRDVARWLELHVNRPLPVRRSHA